MKISKNPSLYSFHQIFFFLLIFFESQNTLLKKMNSADGNNSRIIDFQKLETMNDKGIYLLKDDIHKERKPGLAKKNNSNSNI